MRVRDANEPTLVLQALRSEARVGNACMSVQSARKIS